MEVNISNPKHDVEKIFVRATRPTYFYDARVRNKKKGEHLSY